jgi:ATP-dependent RNA circularization protein (DNA/RNA ligase family)
MSNLIKYPRTLHFPFSEGATSDDKILNNTDHFIGKEIIITEKMDGENTTIYNDNYHARSLSSKHQSYHSWLLSFIPIFQKEIPDNWRICGEYLYAKHSIAYNNLPTYFMVFSVWDENNNCLSWSDTKEFCDMLNLQTVPVLYKGIYDEELIKRIAKETVSRGGEGIVVRLKDSFNYDEFSTSIAKFVRKNHVQTSEHWTSQKIIKNQLI